jgi:metallophosphoesterase (TIGR00282 family)
MRILFLGDVFGTPGRRALERRLPSLREELSIDFCCVNAENASGIAGLLPKHAESILGAGADAITLGNHVWRRSELIPYLDTTDRIVRPANLSRFAPGRGMTVLPAADGTNVAVVDLLGALFMNAARGPFEVVDDVVAEASRRARVVVVDIHAEATSEKVGLARWLSGRVTAVFGSHTHVQTNDARVLEGGTAAITDAGMTGAHDSVIGVRSELAIQRMRTGINVRFEPAEGGVRIEGALVECDANGRATSCEAIRLPGE